jgi:Domain of unknown function (DUF6434)
MIMATARRMIMVTTLATSMIEPDTRPFDWHYSTLSSHTMIAPDYRHTQNVRRFFKAEIGEFFKFDRPFMSWMQDNSGKTLGDAVDEWRRRKGYKDE